MSQLPAGTTAVKEFLRNIVNAGVGAAATAWLPGLAAVPVLGYLYLRFVKWVVDRLILDPLLSEATALALALVYVLDRAEFDKQFIAASMLDRQGASPEERERVLQNAEKAMARFIRRSPIK